jgi:hypothetical protein
VLIIGVAVVQALFGLVLVLEDFSPTDNYHYLYGISLIVFMGAAYVFATRGDARREALIFGMGSAFAFGLILRAGVTA